MLRRDFLKSAAVLPAAVAPSAAAWSSGAVDHILPAVNHERILLKVSFGTPPAKPPRLRVGRLAVPGQQGDTGGRYWMFFAKGLEPSRPYQLSLEDARGKPLCDPWTLKTFPAPADRPERLRLLIYTCAGGHDVLRVEGGGTRFLPLAVRRRLLDRALAFQPDALIANGDHVYWDLRTRTAARLGASAEAVAFAGRFDRSQPVFGTPNERVLERAAGPQVAGLYGARCRSVPVFFVQDDHDYFENDEADDQFVSLPPDYFMLGLGRATRRLYYPEFLPDPNRPAGLPGASAPDTAEAVSECFGTLRYGRLAEILMYDCRRFLTLAGPSAGFVPPETEQWLKARMSAPEVAHVVNVPSTPPGWSAGKWGEWYPDILDAQARLGVSRPKPYWQPGWGAQHDRLLGACSSMRDRVPLFISGDLHSIGETRIHASGKADFRARPVVSVLSGPLGTASDGWPSSIRGTRALPPAGLEVDERFPALEENGFLIADFTPDKITLRFFRWIPRQPVEAIDSLQPFREVELSR